MLASPVLNPYCVNGVFSSAYPFFDVNLSTIKVDIPPGSTYLDGNEAATTNFLAYFETALLELDFAQAFVYYEELNSVNVLKSCIAKYFRYLHSRLMNAKCTYLDLIEPDSPYAQYNLASYGQTFWLLLEHKMYPLESDRKVLRNYSILIHRYLTLFPVKVGIARLEIMRCLVGIERENQSSERNVCRPNSVMESTLIEAFRIPSERDLSTLEDFVNRFSLPTQRRNMYRLVCDCFKHLGTQKYSPDLLLNLQPVGGDLSTGQNIDCADVHFHLSIFNTFDYVQLDCNTMALLAKLVIALLKLKLGLNGTYVCGADRRNVVEFDISQNYTHRKGQYGGKLCICLNSELVQYRKLVNFYICHEPRFVCLTLLLKHWFHYGRLLCPTDFANETFVWLVILFLQQTKPPLLPSMKEFVFSGAFAKGKYIIFRPVSLKSSNLQRISSLILDFVQFYLHFDFRNQRLSRWDGTCTCTVVSSAEESTTLNFGDPPRRTVSTCYSVEHTDMWKVALMQLEEFLANDGNIECKHLWNPKHFAVVSYLAFLSPKFKSPGPLPPITIPSQTAVPKDPYLTTESEWDQLKCSSEIGSLKLTPNNYPPNAHKSVHPFQFAHDFIYTTKPMSTILPIYNSDLLNAHIMNVVAYFTHLQTRLQNATLSYSTLLSPSVLQNVDYVSYGPRFWQWLLHCGRFPENIFRNYSILIYRYRKMFPSGILKLREAILNIHLELVNKPKVVPEVIDYKLVTYKNADMSSLHLSICQLDNVQQQIDHILQQVYNPNQAKRFVEIIERLSQHPKLVPLKPKLTQLGVLKSGLSIYSFYRCFTFNLSFESLGNEDCLDWSTSVLMFQVIRLAIKLRYNLDSAQLEPYRLTYSLDSTACPDKSLRFHSLCIQNEPNYAKLGQLVNRLAQVEPRFGQVILLLQYWADCNQLSMCMGSAHNLFVFIWLIIFALQNTYPRVLVPVECLPSQGVPTQSTNHQSTTELIVHFFKFYSKFDFANQVICPRNSYSYSKVNYETINRMKLDPNSSSAFLEDPFTQKMFYFPVCSGEMNQFDRLLSLCTRILSVGALNSVNCLQVLTDPVINNGRQNKSANAFDSSDNAKDDPNCSIM